MAMTQEQLQVYMEELVARARKAQKEFEKMYLFESDQKKVDEVVRAIGKKVCDNGMQLAMDAVAQTGMGDIEGKMGKMFGVALFTWNYCKGKKSIGVIDDGVTYPGVRIVAKPMGVIGAVMPSTNPIATILNNAMCALKCRNSIIIASHPASIQVTEAVVGYMREALVEVGAPIDLVQCINAEAASVQATGLMMSMCDCNVGTGGPGMVKACYSAGKPAYGVGQGNSQVVIDEDAPDMGWICGNIIGNRSADQGVPCTGEQMVHLPAAKEAEFVATMQACGAYLIDDPELIEKLRPLCFPDGKNINRKVVGRSPKKIGEMLGIEIPEAAKVLLVKVTGVAEEDVLCREILFPFVRYRVYENFKEGVAAMVANLEMEGAGHSSGIWSNIPENIDYAAYLVPVGRFHTNNSTGGLTSLPVASTIGCGTWGGNSMSENLNYIHFMNKTHVTTPDLNPHLPEPADWDIWE